MWDSSGVAPINDTARFFHTVRHLKPAQILGRLRFRLRNPKPRLNSIPDRRARGDSKLFFPQRPQRMLGPGKFRFLNRTVDLDLPRDWDNPGLDKLWLYNLHYFEDLIASGANERLQWHRELMQRWIQDNPPACGNGWEPYPLSLRIVNWIKWILKGNRPPTGCLESLALQSEALSRRVEWHLLGNHLFENARALFIAGCFFEGGAAVRWQKKALRILDRQIEEQVLPDGGHFERSPMYHALVLEGLLDLIQIGEYYGPGHGVSSRWRRVAVDMLAWLRTMTHPDGEIAFFNDAAAGVALAPLALEDYARRLGLQANGGGIDCGATLLESSGYVAVRRSPLFALIDTAPLGPDYLPGHGHADTLAFELSVHGQRVLVNSGTRVYGTSNERLTQRGTAAHNTVVVDGENSSEVWSGFRVARRARPFDVSIRALGEECRVQASHDGYWRLPGKVTHTRICRMTDSRLIVEDMLSGTHHEATAYFHFHPDFEVLLEGLDGFVSAGSAHWLRFSVRQGEAALTRSTYHPEFGVDVENGCLCVGLVEGKSCVAFDVLG